MHFQVLFINYHRPLDDSTAVHRLCCGCDQAGGGLYSGWTMLYGLDLDTACWIASAIGCDPVGGEINTCCLNAQAQVRRYLKMAAKRVDCTVLRA